MRKVEDPETSAIVSSMIFETQKEETDGSRTQDGGDYDVEMSGLKEKEDTVRSV